MSLLTKTNIVRFSTPSDRWTVTIPEQGKYPNVLQVYKEDTTPASWDYTVGVSNGELVVDFGLDEYAGELEYSWKEDTVRHSVKVSDEAQSSVVHYSVNSSSYSEVGTIYILHANGNVTTSAVRHHSGAALQDISFVPRIEEDGLYLDLESESSEQYVFHYNIINL